MTEKKPGLFKRAFSVLGRIFSTIRNVFSFLIFGFFILAIGGMFGENLQPIPEKGALYLAPQGFLVDQKTYTDPFNQILFQIPTHHPPIFQIQAKHQVLCQR